MKQNVEVQQLIDHIKGALDVDPWAKEMAENLLKRNIPAQNEVEGSGNTWWIVCPECHGAIDNIDKFCRHCGQGVHG